MIARSTMHTELRRFSGNVMPAHGMNHVVHLSLARDGNGNGMELHAAQAFYIYSTD